MRRKSMKTMKMKVRAILFITLLLAAVPSFALPNCKACDTFTNRCVFSGDASQVCLYNFPAGTCYIDPFAACNPTFSSTVAADWKVASIEITRPSLDSITVTAPATAAETEVREAEAVEQK
jgi:hypothetical protein